MESTRLLTTHDRAALEAFKCAIYREDWTREPELLIQRFLPDGIADGTSRGLGIWDNDLLLGVASWSEQESHLVWRVSALAVATGHQGRQIGRRLKQAVVDQARLEGCMVIQSYVHRDNDRMLAINRRFNADIKLDPEDARKNTMICTITV